MCMCARTRTNIPPSILEAIFKNLKSIQEYEPSFNVAPTEMAPIIAYGKEGLSLINARFGLIPSWSKDLNISFSTFNARSEKVEIAKAFKVPFAKRHCIVPVSGFYEWRKENGKKQPYLFERRDGEPMFLAGLWDYWEPKEGDGTVSFSIITTEANQLMSDYHGRMPVILDENEFNDWLESKPDKSLLDPYPSQLMSVRPISDAVNSVKHKQDVLLNSL